MIGSGLEDNARVAMYLHRLNQGDTFELAADYTKLYLFDYTDLTASDEWIKRNVGRFFTFSRKNTPLQVLALMQRPGRTRVLVDVHKELSNQVNNIVFGAQGEDGAVGDYIPPWAQAAAMTWMGGNIVGGETPFSSAMESIESIAALGTIPLTIFGLRDSVPEEIRDAVFYGNTDDQIGRFFALTSGLSPSLIQFFNGEQANVNLFTGARLEDSRTNEASRLLGSVNPTVARGLGIAESVGWDG